jgi:HSP20 family protein
MRAAEGLPRITQIRPPNKEENPAMYISPFGLPSAWTAFRDLERLVDDLHSSFTRTRTDGSIRRGEVPLNIWSGDQGLVITAEVPGVDPASISVNVLGDTLTFSGKRAAGEEESMSFTRTVNLPYRVDPDRTQARCTDGILSIALERPEAERPRSISVNAA